MITLPIECVLYIAEYSCCTLLEICSAYYNALDEKFWRQKLKTDFPGTLHQLFLRINEDAKDVYKTFYLWSRDPGHLDLNTRGSSTDGYYEKTQWQSTKTYIKVNDVLTGYLDSNIILRLLTQIELHSKYEGEFAVDPGICKIFASVDGAYGSIKTYIRGT